ncbi:hybrid sensor histidine kinase/response regulator transcription factor [Pleomorphovibrio marinus]|uniref:hybrid sensor histidine kinase/response regulator transcription factor n=1 Tax=Pleomorphovibrio marinus TaxID=2164132 RepID=UPI000E0A6880|nr:hybrid sensor histidine kinase/response regulator transcription factor [Pleomorphovibrio marinus]
MMPIFLPLFLFIMSFFQGAPQSEDTKVLDQTDLNFYLMDVDDGLAHNVVFSLAQDSLGYIWIATLDGVSRYNGKDFENYRHNPQSPGATLANNYVQQLLMDQGLDLWMATDGGLTKYELLNDRWITEAMEEDWAKSSISAVTKNKRGDLFAGLYSKGLLVSGETGESTLLKHESNNPNTLSSNLISSLTHQGDSMVWIGTFDAGVCKLDVKQKTVYRIPLRSEGQSIKRVNVVYSDVRGNMWIGSQGGLHVITVEKDTLHMTRSPSPLYGLSDDEVLSLEEDQFGRLWVGTRNGGLNIFDPVVFLENPSQPDLKWYLPKSDGSSVFNRTVSALFLDRENNMWIGTSTGVNFVNPGGEPVKWVQRNPGNENSISHNRIGALARSKSVGLWVGTDGGGIDLYDPQLGKIKNLKHEEETPNSLSNNFVISLLEDTQGRLWAGTYRGGINLWDEKINGFKKFLQGEPKDGSDVRVIFESSDHSIWVGTNQGGLYKFEEEEESFTFIEALNKSDIRGISEDAYGNLWLATYGNGVIRYNPFKEETKHYDTSNFSQLEENIFFSTLCMEDGTVLAGSRYGGLIRIDPASDHISQFTEADGLSNNTISSLAIGADGLVWMGTFQGISYFNPQRSEFGNLNTLENIQRGEFYIGAIAAGKEREVYFGGNKGLNVIDTRKLGEKRAGYPLLFENFSVANQKVGVDKEVLDSALSFKRVITIDHDKSLFSFNFNLLKFPFARQVQYAYFLEGYHKQWVSVNESGTANLSRIPPGKYILRVKASTGNGLESTNSMAILIPPPFWKTWPAYLFYFLLFGALVFGFFNYYTERIKLKNSLLLERKMRQLERGVNEERIRFFTNFSHELKTPLTLIIAPLEELNSALKGSPYYKKLKLSLRNANYLHTLIGDLLEFRKAETGIGRLEVGGHDLVYCLKKWVKNHMPLARRKGIELDLLPMEESFQMANFDVDKLQIVVNNLLSNALKYCTSGDRVKVSYHKGAFEHCIRVEDSGPGIPKEEFPKLFEWFYRADEKSNKEGTGIGLALAKRLMELHGGGIEASESAIGGIRFQLHWPLDLPVSTVEKEIDGEILHDLQAAGTESDQRPKEVNASTEKEVILIVDDNEDIVEYLEEIFTPTYEVIKAKDGVNGFQAAIHQVPDLIISDVMMPRKDGLDLCSALKSHFATTHIPIILLTAKSSPASIQEGFREGADEYMVKPFNTSLLQVRVENLLDNRRMLRKYFLKQQSEEEIQSLGDTDSGLVKTEQEFLHKINGIIIDHMQRGNTHVEEIAQEIGMSRTSLYRKMKALTGESINEYIRKLKIQYSAKLIEIHGYTISQAAFEVGFNDLKYFRKVFKEHFGKLPSELKKQP